MTNEFIQNLALRTYRGEEDAAILVDIINDGYRTDGIDETETVEGYASFLANPSGYDIAEDLRIAEVNGEAVAFARVRRRDLSDGDRVYWHTADVRGAWRGRGIGTALEKWMLSRIDERAASEPHTGKTFVQSWCAEKSKAKERMMEKFGFVPKRYGFKMVRPHLENIPDFALPDDLEIRPVMPSQLRAIWEADTEAFRDHWGFFEPTEDDYANWLKGPHHLPVLYKVAFDKRTGEVAGQVQNFINLEENEIYARRRGYTEGISTRRKYRKRGVARALICESLRMHKALGMTEAALGVDAENTSGALSVYRSCGFEVVEKDTTYRKEWSSC